MADYDEARRFARAYVNVTRNLELLRRQFIEEFGDPKWAPPRAKHGPYPPAQAGASTEIRGKLAGYREAYRRGHPLDSDVSSGRAEYTWR